MNGLVTHKGTYVRNTTDSEISISLTPCLLTPVWKRVYADTPGKTTGSIVSMTHTQILSKPWKEWLPMFASCNWYMKQNQWHSWKEKQAEGLRHTQPLPEMMCTNKTNRLMQGDALSAEAPRSSHSALPQHSGGCSIFPQIWVHSCPLYSKSDPGRLMMWDSAD